jgi:hypothetical protein
VTLRLRNGPLGATADVVERLARGCFAGSEPCPG